MGKFKVGDKVRLKNLEEMKRISKNLYNIPEYYLETVQGEVFTIKKINIYGKYMLKEDKYCYWYLEEFLEKVDTFSITLPKDFSGTLVIEKGKIVKVEEKKEILDEVEKEYLRAVIKPFRKRVKNITKFSCIEYHTEKEFIHIKVYGDTPITLPYFKKNTMYKDMELNRKYTLEELGL